MPLKNRWFKDQIGVVRFVTGRNTKKFVTVEVSKTRTAFGFSMDGRMLSAGDIIKFDGMAKIKVTVSKRKLVEEKNLYYHDPLDKSSNLGWFYYELTNVTYDVMEDEDAKIEFRNLSDKLLNCAHSWSHINHDTLLEVTNNLQKVSKIFNDKINKMTLSKLIDVSDFIESIKD